MLQFRRTLALGLFLAIMEEVQGFSPSNTMLSRTRNTPGFPLHDSNSKDPSEERFWVDRWGAADTWEVRQDATVLSCHTLARFLAYDVTLPIKEVPGLEVEDVIALLDTFTSCIVLALFWTSAGLVTQLFEDADGGDTDWGRLVQTTMLAAPPWLLLEFTLGWPAFESTGVERIIVGSLGLLVTMSLARFVSSTLLPR